MTCKGICTRYKAVRGRNTNSWYKVGAKRCNVCEIFIKWETLWCPCCGYRLKCKPRSKSGKENLRSKLVELQ